MRTREEAEKNAELLHTYIATTDKFYACDVKVVDVDVRDGEKTFWELEVLPAVTNKARVIFRMEAIADFCRGTGLGCWIGARGVGEYPEPFVRII